MASVVLIWTPIFRMEVLFSTGFRSISRLIGPSQKDIFSILDHNQFPFKPQSFLQLIHFDTFTSSMASLRQNVSSPRNSQPSNMDPYQSRNTASAIFYSGRMENLIDRACEREKSVGGRIFLKKLGE
jgi:hypothetical protein